jgi:hypothetical protein
MPSSKEEVVTSKQQAKSFLVAIVEAGSNIQAIGKSGYVLAEPVVIDDREAYERIDRVAERFGDVTHLKQEIVDYLIKVGRVIWPNDLA